MNSEITAVISSVTQNAFQTPFTSNARLSRNAAGIITTMNLHSEIISDGTPLPSPSSEPEAVTDTDDKSRADYAQSGLSGGDDVGAVSEHSH